MTKNQQFYITIALLNFLLYQTNSVDCIYHPQNFSVTSLWPFNPLMTCLQYCRQIYTEPPQRTYYNTTSHNCQPQRRCYNFAIQYYDYNTNRCYTNETLLQQSQSYIPSTVLEYIIAGTTSIQMNCINGQFNMVNSLSPALCLCDDLWITSGMVDMKGYPFKCDKVTSNPSTFLVSNPHFTHQQISVMMTNMNNLQTIQQSQYAYNHSAAALYKVSTRLKKQPFIRSNQYLILSIIIFTILCIIWISYWQYSKLRIVVTQKVFKKRVLTVLQNQNYLREIY